MKNSYSITGVHCGACLEKIRQALQPITHAIEFTLDPPTVTLQLVTPMTLAQLNTHVALAGNYQLQPLLKDHTGESNTPGASLSQPEPGFLRAYYPLMLIFAYVAGVPLISALSSASLEWHDWMRHFMAGFFLVFSAFKLLDLAGFAQAYRSYDLLAKRWQTYGFIYPFIELGLGLAYLTQYTQTTAYLITIIIMGFSSMGVLQTLFKKQQFRCACLGTLLNVPMSIITLIEDLAMVIMAAVMLAF